MRRLMLAFASLSSFAVPAMAADLYYPAYGERDVYIQRPPVVERERIIERRYYREPIVEAYPVPVPRAFVYEHSAYDVDYYDYPRPYYRRHYWRHDTRW